MMVTHFADDDHEGMTLCGGVWTGIVWSNDLRATCIPCQDVWSDRTDWAFPLPETVD